MATKILTALAGALLFATLALAPTLALAQGVDRPETLADTARLIRDRLIADGSYASVSITADSAVEARREGEDPHVFFPDNLHRILQSLDDPEARRTALDDHMSAIAEAAGADAPELSSATLDLVYPVLRHRDYGAGLPQTDDLIREPFAGDLMVFYVLDSPRSVRYLNAVTAREAGITLDTLRAAAQVNLARLSGAARIETDWVSVVLLDGYYESSLLLDDALWHAIAREMPNLVMITPARDLVAFGNGSDAEVVRFLREKAVEISQEAGGQMSEALYRWSEIGWILAQ